MQKTGTKCSFASENDLANLSDPATWLYIYGYSDEPIAVCDLLKGLGFSGNYNPWCMRFYSLPESKNFEGTGNLPISDKEFDRNMQEIIDALSKLK